MNKYFCVSIVVWSVFNAALFAQADKHLKSKLNVCTMEVEQLEKELTKNQELLQLQTKAVRDLKGNIQENSVLIDQLKRENMQLQEIAVSFLNVALKLEESGNTQGALEVYKALIKSYPNSLEAVASRIQIQDYTSDLKGYTK